MHARVLFYNVVVERKRGMEKKVERADSREKKQKDQVVTAVVAGACSASAGISSDP